jgi:hypothetical protein
VFTSVAELTEAITDWAAHWNNGPKPFIWHKAADEIINEVRRGRAALHQIKSATRHELGDWLAILRHVASGSLASTAGSCRP